MLPISDVIFAKKSQDSNSGDGGIGIGIEWILYDVYKIASDFPLEISTYGHIFDNEVNTPMKYAQQRLKITNKFLSKSTRDDLKGLKLTCARVVCVYIIFFVFRFSFVCIKLRDKRKMNERNSNDNDIKMIL